MPYSFTWEPRGIYTSYFDAVTILERLESFEGVCASPRFDDMRYSITDCLHVEHYEASEIARQGIAAMHVGPLQTNPRVIIAAVAIEPGIISAIKAFVALNFTSQPYRIFPTMNEARSWVVDPLSRTTLRRPRAD